MALILGGFLHYDKICLALFRLEALDILGEILLRLIQEVWSCHLCPCLEVKACGYAEEASFPNHMDEQTVRTHSSS